MWEVEPRLYWKVKINGKWTWRVAEVLAGDIHTKYMAVLPPEPPEVKVDETEN